MSANPTHSAPHASAPLAVNHLARSYQPRRVSAAAYSIIWNLALAVPFLSSGAAERLLHLLPASPLWNTPLYIAILFAAYALVNFPIELWFGYLEERQFGLAKDGIRAWARDWLAGTFQHAFMFITGSSLIVAAQHLLPTLWLPALAAVLLALFLLTTWQAPALLPNTLFHHQPADTQTHSRLRSLLPSSILHPPSSSSPQDSALSTQHYLPPLIIYSHPNLREFSGGLLGLGRRQVLLISRSTLDSASDSLLRFVLLHELGHRRYHHILLSALAGWAWIAIGLCVSHQFIPAAAFATPLYIAHLALALSLWMAVGEPLLAYLGRRLEYQADRYYLNHGGTLEEMKTALDELAQRNLARTEALRRRETLFHPLPSITNRLHAASRHKQPATSNQQPATSN